MNQMRVALAFGRPDVNALLDELDHDAYVEWLDYFSIQPHGWDALNLAQARISTMIALVHGSKRTKDRDMLIKSTPPSSDRNHELRLRAMSIRSNIIANMKAKRRGKGN